MIAWVVPLARCWLFIEKRETTKLIKAENYRTQIWSFANYQRIIDDVEFDAEQEQTFEWLKQNETCMKCVTNTKITRVGSRRMIRGCSRAQNQCSPLISRRGVRNKNEKNENKNGKKYRKKRNFLSSLFSRHSDESHARWRTIFRGNSEKGNHNETENKENKKKRKSKEISYMISSYRRTSTRCIEAYAQAF